jgi:Spy/CpxP family protein refolding chaperone
MLTKSKLAIAAALVLGAASAAQAASENPSDPTRGFAYGPMGQRMGGPAVNPVQHLSTRYSRGAYAYVPPGRMHIRRSWHWE